MLLESLARQGLNMCFWSCPRPRQFNFFMGLALRSIGIANLAEVDGCLPRHCQDCRRRLFFAGAPELENGDAATVLSASMVQQSPSHPHWSLSCSPRNFLLMSHVDL